MKLIDEELESIWDGAQEFVVQISPRKLERKQKDKFLCEYKYWRKKKDPQNKKEQTKEM